MQIHQQYFLLDTAERDYGTKAQSYVSEEFETRSFIVSDHSYLPYGQ